MTPVEQIYQLYKKQPRISTDSRRIDENCIFFALKGEHFNGNQFAQDALKNGAVCSVIDNPKYCLTEKTILVDDTLKTLQELARLHRRNLNIPILAITGTNGKTTTKELVSSLLSKKYKVAYTSGNLNNHIGVPLTLLEMGSGTEFGVVEMGANHPGEIDELCRIAEPDYGIITNIGKAHLEGFGSFEGVIRTKTELYDYLRSKNGMVFINLENKMLHELSSDIKRKVTYGTQNADFVGERIQSPPYVHVRAKFPKGFLYLNSNLTGDFNFENILAAACIGHYFGIVPLKIKEAISEYHPKNNRSQLINKGQLKIILDAYNANPSSMQVSISSFLSNWKGENYLILGDMLELGPYSGKEHKKMLDFIINQDCIGVYLVGNEFSKISAKYPFKSFLNVEQLCQFLQKNAIKKGNIFIKGSRKLQLEKVLNCL